MKVFSKEWFLYYQETLLRVCNTKIGRRILEIDTDKPIIHLRPNSYHYIDGIDTARSVAITKGVYSTYPKYANILYKKLKFIWRILHCMDWLVLDRQSLIPNFGFATLDEFDAENITYTGVRVRGWDGSDYTREWDGGEGCKDATVGYNLDWVGWVYTHAHATDGDGITFISRQAVQFDTDSILNLVRPTSITIESYIQTFTNIGMWTGSKNGVCLVNLVQDTPGGDITYADSENFDLSEKASDDVYHENTPIVEGMKSEWDLNAHGLTGLNKEGYSAWGFVWIADQEDIFPNFVGYSAYQSFRLNSTYDDEGYPEPHLIVVGELPVINIGDNFKEIELMNIKIGGSWKTVSNLSINIGDVWKTLF